MTLRICAAGAAVTLISLWPAAGATHPGGLDANGCHNDRKTGQYHCHRGEPRRQPAAARTPQAFVGGAPQGAYRNCTAARAAGAAPLRRGQPGYGPHLDRDNDGVACEPYRGR
ncbi:excalibur calcium-binding domain-containing protein [Phenylobacterium sp. Root77]|uniref:excalibur calcium-binding domain-containing protein n=2 Tax=Phenylobacterium TaxID=20 RepID=UPI0009EA1A1B|nr:MULTISPECIES: excalibur calcium-binding domain-containing protein [unclassified Phenylobacterium]